MDGNFFISSWWTEITWMLEMLLNQIWSRYFGWQAVFSVMEFRDFGCHFKEGINMLKFLYSCDSCWLKKLNKRQVVRDRHSYNSVIIHGGGEGSWKRGVLENDVHNFHISIDPHVGSDMLGIPCWKCEKVGENTLSFAFPCFHSHCL